MTLLQDVKYGLRQLRQRPSFSLVAVLTLALGIGVSTALFSVIDAALLRPLPYPHPEELVTLSVEETRAGGEPAQHAPSLADIRRWRALDSVIAHAGLGRVSGSFTRSIVETGVARRLTVGVVSEDFLETYGMAPILGRSIVEDDMREGAPAVVLLGHAFWQTEFGADPNVLGRTLRVENEPVTIVGVLPAGFYTETAVWRPLQWPAGMVVRRGTGTPAIARLRPGVTLAQARAVLDAATPPGPDATTARSRLESMYDDETSGFGSTIRTLAMAVGLILVIACVNVAALVLARGATREVELAIRASIGAGRGRLVQQLLTESVLLATIGAVVGILFAYLSLDALVALIPLALPQNAPVAINGTVLAFALALTVATALLFGLVPALKLSRAPKGMSSMLSVAGGGSPLSRRAGQWLIAIEIALALVLMTGAGVILRSFAKLLAVDLGFDTANVVTLEVEPLDQAASVRRDYYVSLAQELRHRPGVISVGAIDPLALTGGGSFSFPKADTGQGVQGPQRVVLPGYLEALGVRPLAGRLLEETDVASGEAVVVNTMLAERYFASSAVGHTLQTSGKPARTWRIVGVVPNIRHGGPQEQPQPQMYVLPDPRPVGKASLTLAMVMRLRDGTSLGVDGLKRAAEDIGPRVVVGRVRPVSAFISQQIERPRHRMVLLTMLGTFGLLLTLVGIFSMTAYAVARRTREIGVRVAFGARPAQVVGLMIRDAAWPIAFGLMTGLAGAYYAMRVIRVFLFQTVPYDPPTLVAAVSLLATTACIAAWIPARRAALVDPLIALRAE